MRALRRRRGSGRFRPSFSLGKFRAKKNGTGTIKVTVSGPGKVVAAPKTSGKKKALVQRTSRTAKQAGPITLTIKPSKLGSTRLAAVGGFGVKVKIAFKPAVGAASDVTRSFKLKLDAKPK